MSLERIREAILSKAREEAQRIGADAARRHDERLAAATEAIEAEFARRLERARQHTQRESDRDVTQARSGHNLALLKLRNRILSEVFEEAARQLAALPDDAYRDYVRGRMREVPPGLAGQLLCSARDEQRLAPLLEEFNAGRPPEARLALVPGDVPSLGGVIVRTEKFEIDLSLDTQVQQLREELAPQLAQALFPPDVTV